MRTKIKISDIFAYIIGNYRYWCYNNFKPLLRLHIIEQYEWRLSVMNKECYNSGSCIKCGCDTPALQMANKACEGGCYFEMFDKKKWKAFKIKVQSREDIERLSLPLQILLLARPLTPPILTTAEVFPKKEGDEEYEWPIMKNNLTHYIAGIDPYKEGEESQGPIIVKGYHSRDPRVQGMTGVHEYLVRQEEKLKNKE